MDVESKGKPKRKRNSIATPAAADTPAAKSTKSTPAPPPPPIPAPDLEMTTDEEEAAEVVDRVPESSVTSDSEEEEDLESFLKVAKKRKTVGSSPRTPTASTSKLTTKGATAKSSATPPARAGNRAGVKDSMHNPQKAGFTKPPTAVHSPDASQEERERGEASVAATFSRETNDDDDDDDELFIPTVHDDKAQEEWRQREREIVTFPYDIPGNRIPQLWWNNYLYPLLHIPDSARAALTPVLNENKGRILYVSVMGHHYMEYRRQEIFAAIKEALSLSTEPNDIVKFHQITPKHAFAILVTTTVEQCALLLKKSVALVRSTSGRGRPLAVVFRPYRNSPFVRTALVVAQVRKKEKETVKKAMATYFDSHRNVASAGAIKVNPDSIEVIPRPQWGLAKVEDEVLVMFNVDDKKDRKNLASLARYHNLESAGKAWQVRLPPHCAACKSEGHQRTECWWTTPEASRVLGTPLTFSTVKDSKPPAPPKPAAKQVAPKPNPAKGKGKEKAPAQPAAPAKKAAPPPDVPPPEASTSKALKKPKKKKKKAAAEVDEPMVEDTA